MELPLRQVHLDFHTSELIGGIGSDFDAERFAATLKAAHVNSVTCFSRCHHGWIYHDTKFAEARHPHLTCNLLPQQVAACHAVGIRVPVYITVGWDVRVAREHPEWREVAPDGRLAGAGPLEPGWPKLCFNTPYIEFVAEQTAEVFDLCRVDGVFFDIVFQNECCCPRCMSGMSERGYDPTRPPDRQAYAGEVLDSARRRLFGEVRKHSEHATVFFNAGHISPAIRSAIECYTHLELESLPSGGWGYMHFPVTARYARKLGLPTMGMTGKFHVTWGHFSSFKSMPALEYESFVTVANAAACSIGDQLHPRGVLCEETYRRIGQVYGAIEEREPWYIGAEAITEVAVYNTEALRPGHIRLDHAMTGAARALLETAHQFDIVDGQMDWSSYRVLILPDAVSLDEQLADRVRGYLAAGGAVLATGRSGMKTDGSGFELSEWPVEYVREARVHPDFILAGPSLQADMPSVPFVAYEVGLECVPRAGSEVLATTFLPYFERTYAHFCSHFHAPIERQAEYPSAVRLGRCIYLSHPHFTAYAKHGAGEDALIVRNAMALLLDRPLVRTTAPTTCHITITRQPSRRRWIVHLLHYIPERRSEQRDTIRDVVSLSNVGLAVRTDAVPTAVYLAPTGEPLDSTTDGGYTRLTVPVVAGYAMVVLEGLN